MNILDTLTRSAVSVLPKGELEKKLEKKKILHVKLGMDPTAPDLHLGHAVVLRKMKDFQDAGHKITFLIGDFTARIGDPSGKSKTRPPLTPEEIKKNTETYFEQVGRILDKDKVTVRYNSEWLAKLTFEDVLKLCAKVTVARITERDDFSKRLKENTPVGMHELMYPVMQGYDSVALDADVELGGTDQTFNLLMGRFLQEQYGKEPQVILTMPLLEGLDGTDKMSKSLGNYIGLSEPADKAFGKLMSISDTLMWRYFEVLIQMPKAEIELLQKEVSGSKKHPMDVKKQMAKSVITEFWSANDAQKAQSQFEDVFQKGDLSKAQSVELPADTKNPIWIVELLKILGALKSSSEAKRLIEGGSVAIDGEQIKDFKAEIAWKSGMTIKVGKHRIYTLV
ncbi:MAG: tyrosyl-tRNA synthetase [Alteromonas naphthalenivorans]|jgi:tyrosyl-tRNA synthetase